jgi:hypothetical protein
MASVEIRNKRPYQGPRCQQLKVGGDLAIGVPSNPNDADYIQTWSCGRNPNVEPGAIAAKLTELVGADRLGDCQIRSDLTLLWL